MIPSQFEYLGRWVDTKHFCAFVYGDSGEKLARNYEEFIDLVGSGLWFASKADLAKSKVKVEPKIPEKKNLNASSAVKLQTPQERASKNPFKAPNSGK